MKTKMKRIQSLMGVNRPTVQIYESVMKSLSPDQAEQLNKNLFRLSFGYWNELPDYYRRFFLRLYVHDRELFLHYSIKETPLGSMRYRLRQSELFIKLLHIIEANPQGKRTSGWHLSMALLLVFELPFSFQTLGTYVRRPYKRIQPRELLQMIGFIELDDDSF